MKYAKYISMIAIPLIVTLAACGSAAATSTVTGSTTVSNIDRTPELVTATPSGFTLTSPDVLDGGRLPAEYTCDGAGSTLALTWSGAPAGTKSYAVIMHHIAPETIHWYWVLYDIPVDVTSLPKNVTGIGILGNNINNGRVEYSPPCSKGPGDKTYTYTIYALSAQPQLSVPASQVNRAVLLDAIKDITLTSAELDVIYRNRISRLLGFYRVY
jgi:phosphatidylethanolamine-binding protein (PEBP) family uncharacterized protein